MTYLGDPWGFYKLTTDEQIELMAFHRLNTEKPDPTPTMSPAEKRAEFERRLAEARGTHG